MMKNFLIYPSFSSSKIKLGKETDECVIRVRREDQKFQGQLQWNKLFDGSHERLTQK
jgi:hypothetical protein